jgi:probable O-glycosylation ligase (exosortase A-associated)
MALAMNVPFLFYVARTEVVPWFRRIAQAMFVLSYPAVIGTFSRGAWLALAATTTLLVLKSKHRVLAIFFIVMVALASPMWISHVVSDQIADRYSTLKNYEEDQSANSRFWNWEFCTRVGLGNPLYGGGFYLYSREAYNTYLPEFLSRFRGKVWSCHSTWLSMLAEHGMPGFILWIALLGSAIYSLRQLRRSAYSTGERTWLTDFCYMLQVGLASYMVSSTFVDVGYYEGIYYALVMVIVMKEIARRQMSEASAPQIAAELQENGMTRRVPVLNETLSSVKTAR